MSFLRLFLFILLSLVVVSPVMAQGHAAFCDQVDSTAASQTCLKQHLDSAQKRLNTTYKVLSNKLVGERLEQLKNLQAKWLSYRDAECMWEAEQSETPALKRIHELSCMARVTEDRADLLAIAYADSSELGVQHEYGVLPRWMNVLAKDYPDVSWDYGRRQSYDLNCNGEDEFAMFGVNSKKIKLEGQLPVTKKGEKTAQLQHFSKEIVVAIAQSPRIGRPNISFFKFPVFDKDLENNVCSDNVSMTFHSLPQKEEKNNSESSELVDNQICHSVLKLNFKGCNSRTLVWNGKEFVLRLSEKVDEKKKK